MLKLTMLFTVGGVAAAVSKTAAAPIERVKLLIQNQVQLPSSTSGICTLTRDLHVKVSCPTVTKSRAV
jgi:hypothetical protein